MISPFYGHQQQADPFGFSQPFLSLFNDTFTQLDRLSSDLDSQLTQAFESTSQEGSWQNLLTSSPKFDIKETEAAYILEGELPGIAKKDINLDFVDDHTLVLKTKSETIREQGRKPTEQTPTELRASQDDAQMSGANPEAQPSEIDNSALATTNQTKDVAVPAPVVPTYHLTERTHSTFQRVFTFPADIKVGEVKASLKNGILSVTVPKVVPEPAPEDEAKKGRSIMIEDAGDDAGVGVQKDAQMVEAEAEAEAAKSKL